MSAYALNVRFCEPKYAHSQYIAEYFNTLSNAAYVFGGIYGLLNSPHSFTAKLSYVILIMIGLGSATMHATLQYWAELLDEGPMLCLMVVYQISWSRILFPRYARAFLYFIIAANIIVFAIYLKYNEYDIFVQAFTIQVVIVCLSPLLVQWTNVGGEQIRELVRKNKPRVILIVAHIFTARIGWETEQQMTNTLNFGNWRGTADPVLCAQMPLLAWCHVWWHVQSAYAAYLTIVLLDSVSAGVSDNVEVSKIQTKSKKIS